MTKLLSLRDGPILPYDILRLVFEEAAREDRRKAAKYTLVSKLVCDWVENCLYSDVQLYSEKALRRFLRTLESSTKSKFFFATRVKAITIAYDVYSGSQWASKILTSCSGVESLTIWTIPSHRSVETPPNAYHSHLPQRQTYLQPFPSVPPLCRHSHQSHQALHETFSRLVHPKRLVVLIDKPLYIQSVPYSTQPGLAAVLTPDFSLGMFSEITHLSIVNRWTEWSAWAWSWNTSASDNILGRSSPSKFLPKLTHLSLEIQVGKNSNTLVTPISPQHRNQRLAENVGLPLATILSNLELGTHLRILLCILSFDNEPHHTAFAIREQTNFYLSTFENEQHFHISQPSRIGLSWSGSRSIDPRLVFAYDREPFRDREAGSLKCWNMWKRAEEIVRLQQDSILEANHHPIVFEL